MSTFRAILTGKQRYLSAIFGSVSVRDGEDANYEKNLQQIAQKLNVHPHQITLALGFNAYSESLEDTLTGIYPNHNTLLKERNSIYVSDIYEHIPLKTMLALYNIIKSNDAILQIMEYLLSARIKKIEAKIEATVNSLIIEKYKAEMRAIYLDNIANIDFAEARLSNLESGFRTLLNEACLIAESRLIPVGNIFFRDTILPQEKRKLLNKKLIPINLVKSRLEDADISQQEQKILSNFLKLNNKTQASK